MSLRDMEIAYIEAIYFTEPEGPDFAGLPSAYELAGRHVHIGKIKAVQTCCVGEPS